MDCVRQSRLYKRGCGTAATKNSREFVEITNRKILGEFREISDTIQLQSILGLFNSTDIVLSLATLFCREK